MRKITAIILITVLLTFEATGVFAVDGQQKDGIFTYIVLEDSVTITGVDDVSETVDVPSEIGEYPVTAIGDGAFGGSAVIKTVTLPDSVTSIGSMCFAYSPSIQTVRLSKGITAIPEGLFYQCHALNWVSIPYGVTTVADHAFADCPELMSVTIPNSMTSIADNAFDDCPILKLYCYCSESAVGYTYATQKGIPTEELITVYVNGTEIAFDQPPITEPKKFRTLVPVRPVLEFMGAEIEWFSDMEYAGITIDDHRLLVKPGSDFMMVDGNPVNMSCPAVEYNYRTVLPIRDVVEAIGGKVGWNEYTKEVSITY